MPLQNFQCDKQSIKYFKTSFSLKSKKKFQSVISALRNRDQSTACSSQHKGLVIRNKRLAYKWHFD